MVGSSKRQLLNEVRRNSFDIRYIGDFVKRHELEFSAGVAWVGPDSAVDVVESHATIRRMDARVMGNRNAYKESWDRLMAGLPADGERFVVLMPAWDWDVIRGSVAHYWANGLLPYQILVFVPRYLPSDPNWSTDELPLLPEELMPAYTQVELTLVRADLRSGRVVYFDGSMVGRRCDLFCDIDV